MSINTIILTLSSYGLGAVIAGVVVFFLMRFLLPGYLSQKGKNLATKEDIEEITNSVESVKAEYAKIIEEIRSENQIKIASIEREKALKKEIYMEATEAITKAQSVIADFQDLNRSNEELSSELSDGEGKIAKIQIVGSSETVKSITHIMNSIGEHSLKLALERESLLERKRLIGEKEIYQKKFISDAEKYISIMENLGIEGNKDQQLWEKLDKAYQHSNTLAEESQKEIDTLYKKQHKEHIQYAAECMKSFYFISSLIPNVVLSVRKELELDISTEEYLKIYEDGISQGKLIFSNFLQKA